MLLLPEENFRYTRRREMMLDREEMKHGGLKNKTKRIISHAVFCFERHYKQRSAKI